MNQKQRALLTAEMALMDQACRYLEYSYQRCQALNHKKNYNLEELDYFESLTNRFARLNDMLLQKIFRLLDKIDLEDNGTVRDRIHRAEKKALIHSAEDFIDMRELRNVIAHQYDPQAMEDIFSAVMGYCPMLFETVAAVHCYQAQY